MRRLVMLLWGLATVLALVIVWQGRAAVPDRGISLLVPAPELQLWRVQPSVAAPVPVVQSVPVVPAAEPVVPAAPVPAASASQACSRLGIFPDADWAEQVGLALFPRSGQGEASWVVKAYSRQRYYVVFTGIDAVALGARLELRKAQLRRRVSASTHPEACL